MSSREWSGSFFPMLHRMWIGKRKGHCFRDEDVSRSSRKKVRAVPQRSRNRYGSSGDLQTRDGALCRFLFFRRSDISDSGMGLGGHQCQRLCNGVGHGGPARRQRQRSDSLSRNALRAIWNDHAEYPNGRVPGGARTAVGLDQRQQDRPSVAVDASGRSAISTARIPQPGEKRNIRLAQAGNRAGRSKVRSTYGGCICALPCALPIWILNSNWDRITDLRSAGQEDYRQ